MSDIAVVFVEHSAGVPRRASLEAIGAARATGAEVVAIVAGENARTAAAALGSAGVAQAVVLSGAASPETLAEAAAALAREQSARAFLAAATTTGKDLAARVGAHLDCVVLTDCTSLSLDPQGFRVQRPWLAGKCVATLRSRAKVLVATTRVNAFAPRVETRDVQISERALGPARTRVLDVQAKAAGKLDVKEAAVVISGGRGLRDPEGFKILEDLASAFGNAAVGASRAVVDAGWRPHAEQVGQTGKTVAPPLYIAVGISGAIQHLAGMRTARCIVAINKDPEAPIFKIADYGIVGDAFEVVPALAKAVQEVKAHK